MRREPLLLHHLLDLPTEGGETAVAVIDGAVPGVAPEQIAESVKLARKHGIAATARLVGAPVCESEKGVKITGVPGDAKIWSTIGPQVFRIDLLEKTLANAAKKKLRAADEAALAFAARLEVHLAQTRRMLNRIDSPQDLTLAEYLLRH